MRVSSWSILKRTVFFPLMNFFSGSIRMSRWYESRSLLARWRPYSPRRISARVGGLSRGASGFDGVCATAMIPEHDRRTATMAGRQRVMPRMISDTPLLRSAPHAKGCVHVLTPQCAKNAELLFGFPSERSWSGWPSITHGRNIDDMTADAQREYVRNWAKT